jgi:hypothetical protein
MCSRSDDGSGTVGLAVKARSIDVSTVGKELRQRVDETWAEVLVEEQLHSAADDHRNRSRLSVLRRIGALFSTRCDCDIPAMEPKKKNGRRSQAEGFLITAYPTDAIKVGEVIWAR